MASSSSYLRLRSQITGLEVVADDHARWGCIERYVIHRAGTPETRTLSAVQLASDDDWSSLASVELRVGDQKIAEVTDEALCTLKFVPTHYLPFPELGLADLAYHDVVVILRLRCTLNTCDALHDALSQLTPFLPCPVATIVIQYTRRFSVWALYNEDWWYEHEHERPLAFAHKYLQPLEAIGVRPFPYTAKYLRLNVQQRKSAFATNHASRCCVSPLCSDG